LWQMTEAGATCLFPLFPFLFNSRTRTMGSWSLQRHVWPLFPSYSEKPESFFSSVGEGRVRREAISPFPFSHKGRRTKRRWIAPLPLPHHIVEDAGPASFRRKEDVNFPLFNSKGCRRKAAGALDADDHSTLLPWQGNSFFPPFPGGKKGRKKMRGATSFSSRLCLILL